MNKNRWRPLLPLSIALVAIAVFVISMSYLLPQIREEEQEARDFEACIKNPSCDPARLEWEQSLNPKHWGFPMGVSFVVALIAGSRFFTSAWTNWRKQHGR